MTELTDEQKKKIMFLVDIGNERLINELMDFVVATGNGHMEHINLTRNLLLNLVGNIHRKFSGTPEDFMEKNKNFARDLQHFENRVVKSWDETNLRDDITERARA